MSKLEDTLHFQLKALGLAPEREYRFHPTRRWRFDFAFPACKVGIEVEGGSWVMGRHVRPMGFQNDTDKYNHAVLLGWRILRFTARDVESGEATGMVTRLLGQEA